MKSYNPSLRRLAMALSAVAGYVDAVGFLNLDGLFVSFMSGNSTQMSVGLAAPTPRTLLAAVLIGLFVLGVIMGSITARISKSSSRPAVIAFVTALLALAALLGHVGSARGAVATMTLAMGVVNAVFERDDEIHIGVTYMTGALVKAGQGIAGVFFGGNPLDCLPHLKLWLGLVVGALIGALVYPHLGLDALWIVAMACACLAVTAGYVDRSNSPPSATPTIRPRVR